MGKYRMEEPWGYQEEKDYQSTMPSDVSIAGLFDKVEYNKSDNKMYFYDTYGTKCGTIDVSQFEEESIIVQAYYDKETQEIVIEFVNGDVVRINVKEIIDENEFTNGLQVNDGIVSILVDASGEGYEGNPYLSTSTNGLKIAGIDKHIFDAVEAERLRAVGEETRLDAKIDAEISRATGEESRIEAKLDQEIADRIADVDAEETRAKAEELAANRRIDRLNDELDAEKTIREAADAALGRRIDQEIDDREADVDEEEARAISAETQLWGGINVEIVRAEEVEGQLWTAVNGESDRAQAAEEALDEKIDGAVSGLVDSIDAEIDDRKAEAVASVDYDESGKTINFYNANNEKIDSIDATDFIKDGMIDDVKIENGKLVIVFNTDSGKEAIEIPLTDIFDPSNYYTKAETDENIATETSARTAGDNALEAEIGELATVVEAVDGRVDTEMARALSAETDLQSAIDAEAARAVSAETDIEIALSGKADADVVYTQEEVDALIKAKETEIYNLTKLVGEIGGNVTYDYPNELGTSLTSLLNNSGTVKLGEDATISRFGPGVTAKNKVKLNLNNHNLTSTAAGSYGAIMARGTQEITIYGKGTVDAGDGICIEANGAGCTINLTGSTTVYQNDRSGGELIYCYAGTINITNGTFKNLGENKTFLLNCYDANYKNGTAKIVVTGGKFYDFNPADNTAEGEHTNFLAPGYHVEESQDGDSTVYTVKKDA